MKSDDILYLSLLLFSIGNGFIVRKIKWHSHRQWASTAIGLLLSVYLCTWSVLWSLSSVLLNTLLIKIFYNCHVYSLISNFVLLVLCRMSTSFGLPALNGFANSIQMLLTLKMVGMAHEVSQARAHCDKLKNSSNEIDSQYKLISSPSTMDIIHYAYCYMGLITGPYYKFKTYIDLYTKDYGCDIFCTKMALKRLALVPLFVVLFFISDYFFPLTNIEDPQIYKVWPYWYKVFYMSPIFFNFRMRLYVGFILSECVCIMQGLGAYPESCHSKPGEGPTKDYTLSKTTTEEALDFNTVYNIDVMGSEFRPTVREGMKCWNMTVQYWLVVNVYKPMSGYPKALRTAATMLTSAVWHGVYSGYYLSLLTIPLVLVAEDMVFKVIRGKLQEKFLGIFDQFWLFLKMQWYSYMSIAFILLDVKPILNYWISIGFIGHVLAVFLCVLCQSLTSSRKMKLKE